MRLGNTAFYAACAAAAVAGVTVAVVTPSCSAAQRQALQCQLDALERLPDDPDTLTIGEVAAAVRELRECRVIEVPPDAGAP